MKRSPWFLPNQVNSAQRKADGHDDGRANEYPCIRQPANRRLGQVRQGRKPRVYAKMKQKRRHSEQKEGQLLGRTSGRQQVELIERCRRRRRAKRSAEQQP